MNDISIDRLSLNLTGWTPERGEGLARKIAMGLADTSYSRKVPGDVPGIGISLRGGPNESDDELVGRIVGEIVRQLDQIA